MIATTARPFVRWVGGKGKMLDAYRPFVPVFTGTYFEPFVGGGAMFFDLQRHDAWISDINGALINTYWCVRGDPRNVALYLHEHLQWNSKEYYLAQRQRFNEGIPIMTERAATFLYLSHVGYNGLWRVNKKGQQNVAFDAGRPMTYDFMNLDLVSEALKGVSITHDSFEHVILYAKRNDFLFVDPPYFTEFTKYTPNGFTFEDHQRLRDELVGAHLRGAKWLLSCNDCRAIRNYYRGFTIHEMQESRSVNSNSQGRGKVPCVLIQSW